MTEVLGPPMAPLFFFVCCSLTIWRFYGDFVRIFEGDEFSWRLRSVPSALLVWLSPSLSASVKGQPKTAQWSEDILVVFFGDTE